MQCYPTTPRRVTFLYDNIIDLNENKDVFKDLNEFPPSDYWFSFEYIDAKVKKKVDKTKGQLADDEMEKETKHHVESLNQNPNWLNKITIEIHRFLVYHEYINFFV